VFCFPKSRINENGGNEILDIPLSGNFMVSFDVESLYTNIPLNECIDLAVRYTKEDNTDIK